MSLADGTRPPIAPADLDARTSIHDEEGTRVIIFMEALKM
jgi:hypothetical protein